MNPRTKSRVKSTRMILLVLRICELIGAVGMLFCVISVKGTDADTGLLIRVPVCMSQLRTRSQTLMTYNISPGLQYCIQSMVHTIFRGLLGGEHHHLLPVTCCSQPWLTLD